MKKLIAIFVLTAAVSAAQITQTVVTKMVDKVQLAGHTAVLPERTEHFAFKVDFQNSDAMEARRLAVGPRHAAGSNLVHRGRP